MKIDRESRRCYLCHRPGHIAKNCFGDRRSKTSLTTGMIQTNRTVDKDNTENVSSNVGFECCKCSSLLKDNSLHACCVSDQEVELKCGHKLPVMSPACKGNVIPFMPTETGLLCNQTVTVLRDSGYNGVVVRTTLVPQEKFTGKKRTVYLLMVLC